MSTKNKYMSQRERRELIFACILRCVHNKGLFRMTLIDIAREAQCSKSLVKLHFGGIMKIREYVINFAKQTNNKRILNTPITDIID